MSSLVSTVVVERVTAAARMRLDTRPLSFRMTASNKFYCNGCWSRSPMAKEEEEAKTAKKDAERKKKKREKAERERAKAREREVERQAKGND